MVAFAAAVFACACGWVAALTMMRHVNPMFSFKALMHALASAVPILSLLVANAPPAVAIAGSAVLQLVALYSKAPAKAGAK
jgi:hypothetical protein